MTERASLGAYRRAFDVLERVDGVSDVSGFKGRLTEALCQVYGVRSATFFVGRSAGLACFDPDPVVEGITRRMLPEYQAQWRNHDIFASPGALRDLNETRVASLSELARLHGPARSYVSDYLLRHGIRSATAMYLRLKDGNKALVGLFDPQEDRLRREHLVSLRLLVGPLNQIAHTLPSDDLGPAATLTDLSPRQREVALLVGQGLDNTEIAEVLHLTPASVKKYVTRILAVSGLTTRTQLALHATREL
ncbi:response regulator transcription factor [Nocardioides sp. NPDC057577]|uniref:helix-turn-helix transcriptional regulator n=1 Tax=unclassified Nocardioides TaxID=2615069 RepID=UPI003665F77D